LRPSIDSLVKKAKKRSNPENLGMVLVHNGVVRGTSRNGKKVSGMNLSVNKEKLSRVIKEIERKDGIEAVEVWLNEGNLKVGDDIMIVVVTGRFRSNVLPAFEELISRIKEEVICEQEL